MICLIFCHQHWSENVSLQKMFSSFVGSTVATAILPLQTQSYKTTPRISKKTKKYQARKRHKSKQTDEKNLQNKIKTTKEKPTISYFRRALLKKHTCKHILLVFNPVKIWTHIYKVWQKVYFPVDFYIYSESRTVLRSLLPCKLSQF